jgi:hypothetical protein
MTVYPQVIDDDRSILRIDDNLSELGTTAINQIRAAVFAIEKELGTTPSGSMSSLDSRISVSLNEDGTLKTSAIVASGLIALPIIDSYVATNAGIKEYKLDLDVGTLDLQTQIDSINLIANNTASLASETNSDLLNHIAGVQYLSDGLTRARHFDNQIDLSFTLYDYTGSPLSAIQVEQALYQINQSLTTHQNTVYDAHPATAITVYSQDWNELPVDAEHLQDVLDFIDNQETISTGVDRATLHSNGIPRNARVQRIDLDGYNYEIIPETRCRAFLANPNQTAPRDSISNGDDVVIFEPEDNSGYSFDTLFTQVQVGDILRINYSNGISSQFKVSSIRLTPGIEWAIRINGWNLVNRDGIDDGYAYARIDRRRHDTQTQGVLAVAGAHADVIPDGSCSNALDGIIIGSPRGAMAIGIGFDAGALNEDHYNLWLRLYPTGDIDQYTDLYPIDVTGNLGATPGTYTLESVVETTNRAFRSAGYNYRFIAFQQGGEFGIMLADCWMGASFTIVVGETTLSTIEEGSYINNVVGDATDGYDALGFGASKAVVASPVTTNYTDVQAAVNMPTIIHTPIKGRNYMSNGSRRDYLETKEYTIGDGYWNASVLTSFIDVPNGTITLTYRINELLFAEEVSSGKTIVVQPSDLSNTSISGYGRFIIGNVLYDEIGGTTDILVINSIHSGGDPLGSVLSNGTDVLIYSTEDSVGFNQNNLVEQGTYHRYHEVFADPNSTTYAVERARMEKQSVNVNKLNTDRDNWQIRNVSSNLKGYRLDDNFRYWVRLYITDYNSTTGEFDGYIGSPPNVGAGWETTIGSSRNGPVTTGKKNVPVRFYDETYVNYIDIEFKELTVSPGTVITNRSRYIDIEIFQSFVTDDETMRIAGVSHNETVVGSITDLREFGTISEENFTNSAINFIESSERYLHTNGIVRGFEYTGTGVNDAVLQLSGGIGLVNGSFVAAGAFDVVLPDMRGDTSSYNAFICLTQNGTFRIIPENTGSEFYQSTGDFVESHSFQDIIDKHKEYLILYIVNVTVDVGNYLILNSVTDVRKSSLNESAGITLSISDDEEISSFTTFEQVVAWATKTTADKLYIKVNGNVTIDSAVDLTSISSKLVLEGSGGIITVNSSTGFIIKEGVHFKDLNIVYDNILTVFDSNDLTHLQNEESCIKFVEGASNCRIERCTFSQVTAGERNPYIGIFSQIVPSENIQNIFIDENTFNVSDNEYNCAIGFYQTGISAISHVVTLLKNISINRNIIEGFQSIIITGENSTFRTENVEINGNYGSNFVIGLNTRETNVSVGGPAIEQYFKNTKIVNNNFSILFPSDGYGKYVDNVSGLTSTADIYISGNECYQIAINSTGYTYVINNIFNNDSSLLTLPSIFDFDPDEIYKKLIVKKSSYINIHENSIYVPANGTGIYIDNASGFITSNILTKDGTSSIDSFINTSDAPDSRLLNITDNHMSTGLTSPIGSTDVLKHQPNHLVDRNINDLTTIWVPTTIGEVGADESRPTLSQAVGSLTNNTISSYGYLSCIKAYRSILISIDTTSSSVGFAWSIPLVSCLPYASKISEFTFNASWFSNTGIMSNVRARAQLFRNGTSIVDSGVVSLDIESTEYPITIDCGDVYIEGASLYIRIWPNDGGGSSDPGVLFIRDPSITYLF